MSNRYYATSAYGSKFDASRLFATADEARAFDRGFSASFVAELQIPDIDEALAIDGAAGARDALIAALEFLLAEARDAPCRSRA